jgi:hypothetical protein
MRGLLGLALILALTVLVLTGCDPGHDIKYVNQTNEVATVYINGAFEASINPNETQQFAHLKFDGVETFEIMDPRGEVLFKEQLTWSDLSRRDWTIVVTQR